MNKQINSSQVLGTLVIGLLILPVLIIGYTLTGDNPVVTSIKADSQLAQLITVPTLKLSPASKSTPVGGTFTIDIVIDSAGKAVYGVDINKLHFNPAILQVVDINTEISGVQISPGSLMMTSIINNADNSNGTIEFSQAQGVGTVNGPAPQANSLKGTLATITFKVIKAGVSNVTFDFTSGNSLDCNIAGLGVDILESVVNGTYTGTAVVLDSTLPTIPGTPVLSVASYNKINISWTVSTDNIGVIGYKIFRNGVYITSVTSNTYSDIGLESSTRYTYKVSAFDAAGNNSDLSYPASAITQAPPDTTSPDISNVTLSDTTATSIKISWITDEPATTKLEYGLSAPIKGVGGYGSNTTLDTNLETDHSVTLSGLRQGTSYHYRILASDQANNNTASLDNVFTTALGSDRTKPSAPSDLNATPGENQIQLSWKVPVNTAGDGEIVTDISGYEIFRDGISVKIVKVNTYLDTDLISGKTYSYQITALDSATPPNVSDKSISKSVTTLKLSKEVQRNIIVALEGAPALGSQVDGTIQFLDPNSKNQLYLSSINTNTSGSFKMNVPAGYPEKVIFRPIIKGYLSRLIKNVDLTNSAVLDIITPELPAGDFDGNQLINTLDFSYMNGKWGKADPLADIDKNGQVNSLDYAYLVNNWLKVGE